MCLLVEERLLLLQILLNLPNRRVRRLLAAHEEVGRVDGELIEGVKHLSGFRVDGGEAFDFIVPKLHPHRVIRVRQMHVHRVSLHSEVSASEVVDRAAVEARHKSVQQVVSSDALAHLEVHDVFVKLHGVSDAVDAADARDNNDVPTTAEQSRRRREPKLLDFIVDLQILFDVGVGRRNEGLGLVVIVVAHEVLDEVVGKERLELAVELGSQRFVVAQDECGTLGLGDDVGHREGLSRARYPEQHLVFCAVVHPFDQLANGLGLVPGRLEGAVQLERTHGTKVGVGSRNRGEVQGMKKPRSRRGFSMG